MSNTHALTHTYSFNTEQRLNHMKSNKQQCLDYIIILGLICNKSTEYNNHRNYWLELQI